MQKTRIVFAACCDFLFSDFSRVIPIIESPLPFAKWQMPAFRQVHSKVIGSKTPVAFLGMAAIKDKNTEPEMPIRRTVRTLAFRGPNIRAERC